MIIGHKNQWQFFKRKLELEQLAHAYLFVGSEQIGKKFFAKEFIKYINCLSPKNDQACQKCANCQMIEKNIFPDFKILKATTKKDFLYGDGGEIRISQIREIQKFLNYKPYYGKIKAVIVDGAETMNQEAQSCFLKTLEEPKGKTLLFLISSKPDMILPTIISRCQTVKFLKPKDLPENEEQVEKEKKIFKDLINVINSSFADKFKYVKNINFEEDKPTEILQVIQKYLRHLLLKKTGADVENSNKSFLKLVPKKDYSISKIKQVITLVEDVNNKLVFSNANPKLGLELVLMEL